MVSRDVMGGEVLLIFLMCGVAVLYLVMLRYCVVLCRVALCHVICLV